MSLSQSRRQFLAAGSAALLQTTLAAGAEEPRKPIRVLIWDERQPEQKQAYANFLGNQIAAALQERAGLSIKSVGIDDDDKGLSSAYLRDCDVLIWWGHKRQAEITPEMTRPIIERIKDGAMSLIALHSAHWSTPFVEAMYERTRTQARKTLKRDGAAVEIADVGPPKRYTTPKNTDRLTPYIDLRKFPDGKERAEVHLPICCFPAYRADGKPSQLRVLKLDHPIAQGLPEKLELARTEMYAEPFHVPEPDEVVLEECWASGDWFRSGMVWTIGKGRVFYFRPGHETYPVYKDKNALQVIENAVRWLAPKPS